MTRPSWRLTARSSAAAGGRVSDVPSWTCLAAELVPSPAVSGLALGGSVTCDGVVPYSGSVAQCQSCSSHTGRTTVAPAASDSWSVMTRVSWR